MNQKFTNLRFNSIEELEAALDGKTLKNLPEELKKNLEPKIDSMPHPDHDKVMDVFSKIMKVNHKNVESIINDISTKLIPEKSNPTFPEELFVKFFLPFFAGEVPATKEISISTWLDKISGDPKIAVDIIDNEGNVLYTVPPILDQSVIEQVQPGGRTISMVEKQYSRLKEVSAAASSVYLEKTLVGMHIKDKPTKEVYMNMKAWNDILERYGKGDKIINLFPEDKINSVVNDSIIENVNKNDLSDYELDTD